MAHQTIKTQTKMAVSLPATAMATAMTVRCSRTNRYAYSRRKKFWNAVGKLHGVGYTADSAIVWVHESVWEEKISYGNLRCINHRQASEYHEVLLRSKILRGHHAALDFDKGIIVTSLKSGKDFDLKQEVEIGPRKKKRGRRTQKWDK
jgi:hypothetical protein